MSRVVFLGPQRFQPTLAGVLDRLEVEGTVAVITAGWQEREQEVDELEDHQEDIRKVLKKLRTKDPNFEVPEDTQKVLNWKGGK